MAEYIEREAVNDLIKAECSPKVAAYLIDAVATIIPADPAEERRVMAVCCCSLAGTAACQHCASNPFATDVWTNKTVTVDHIDAKPFGNGLDVCPVCGKPTTIGKPQTNADRLRAMTDEELATFLTNTQVEVFRKVVKEICNLLDISFPYEELTKEVTAKYEEMKKEQLELLKQEATNG